jgi:hypothetical protein
VSDPFNYGDSKDLDFELDLPADMPPPRHAPGRAGSTHPAAPPAPPLGQTASTAPPPPPEALTPREDAFSLELEDVAPPTAQPTLHSLSAPRPAPLQLPQPPSPAPQRRPAARTLEVRVAEAVDRMPPFTRGGLVALTIACMLILGVSVLLMGVRSATHSMGDLARAQGAEGFPGVTHEPK